MKKVLVLSLLISVSMLLIPLVSIKNTQSVAAGAVISNEVPKAEKKIIETFKVYNKETDKITELAYEDYIFGVVAAEMPALYEAEALKAQGVAAYTFACVRSSENKDKPYDITTDHTTDQSFITKEEATAKWGDKAQEYIEKIENAVKDISGYMITYNNSPIVAVYHAISSGKTESCENVWGKDYPYLKSVLSDGDKLAENYISKLTISADELKKTLGEEINLTGNSENYFGNIKRTDAGYIKEINICNNAVSGAKLRSLLNLKSTNFTISFEENNFTFTVLGYGHGVGMSQNGANYMAKQGSNFKEILTHYYKGCSIEKVK